MNVFSDILLCALEKKTFCLATGIKFATLCVSVGLSPAQTTALDLI